jgi:prephenate dehydratase
MNVAIQGLEGSFHQIAAQTYFGKHITVSPCNTFAEIAKKVSTDKEINAGVMAIENSIAGSILPNYAILQKHHLHVIGEVYLQIKQHLMLYPGQQLEDIKEVHSHPMALLQCMDYLNKYPQWRLVEAKDTASAAKDVRDKKSKHIAAIAGNLAAELFNLEIIAPNIHTEKKNYTRFLVLSKHAKEIPETANKASVYFRTNHKKGALVRVLSAIAKADINLSKLQSFPIPGGEWKYYFHADMEFDSLSLFNKHIKTIEKQAETLHVLGVYKKGITS